MSTVFDPRRLDVLAFARAGAALSSQDSLSAYARLRDEAEPGDLAVHWQAQGEWREPVGSGGQAWLHLEADARLPMICQRCLTHLDQPVQVSQWFRFVADEAQADAEDEDCEEDLLVSSAQFDLTALVEDELLLARPMVPMHETCPVPVKLEVRDPDFVDEDAPEAHPFAALAALKKPG